MVAGIKARQGLNRTMIEMERRRAIESRVEARMKDNASIAKTRALAVWEVKTQDAIDRGNCARRIREESSKRQAEVAERGLKLHELYKKEEKMWREQVKLREIEANSFEKRKESLMTRARALQEERESIRKQNVEDCYARQRRSACDEARSRDSLALQALINDEREMQMQIKKQFLQNEKERNEFEDAEAMRNALAAFEKEDAARAANARTKNSEMQVKLDLDQQVLQKQIRRQDAIKKQNIQDRIELDELQAAIASEDAKQQKIRQAARDEGKRVQQYNADSLIQRQAQAQQRKEEDALLLSYALKQEEYANILDAAKQQDQHMLNQRYKSYLDGFEKQKQVDEAKLNAERLRLENRIWDAKDKEQRNQQLAREELAATVRHGRELQLAQKQLEQQKQHEERLQEISYIQEQQRFLDTQEAKKEAQRRQSFQTNAQSLKEQILDKRQSCIIEQQADFLDAKMQRKIEQDHKLAIAKEGGIARLYHPLKSGSWYT